MFEEMGLDNNWVVTTDDNGSMFTSLDSLEKFEIVIFSNTSGSSGLDAIQRANFESYIAGGGSYFGIHAATDTYRHSTANGGSTGDWDWYAENVAGASVQQSPNHTSSNHVDTIYHLIPGISITANIPSPWVKKEEYYYWENGYLAPGFDDVLKVGDTGNNSYDDPRMVARCKDLPGGGRTFYTSLGHDKLNFTNDTIFYQLIEDAMLWVLEGSNASGEVLSPGASEVVGELKTWHKIRLNFGADTIYSEAGTVNPFMDRRLDVTFNGPAGETLVVPGFFAADAKSDSSGADSGNNWSVFFRPPSAGVWTWTTSFKGGTEVAIDTTGLVGATIAALDGVTGTLTITASDKTAPDLRAKGRLEYVGERYRKWAGETDGYFIKVGPDSPENLLGYADFDNTIDNGGAGGTKNDLQNTSTYQDALGDTYTWPGDGLHRFAPHVNDWNAGDLTWGTDQGKGIIGALNYLASKGMNSVSMLLNNVGGDGQEVYPFLTYNNQAGPQTERLQYDISKLEQWELVMDYAEQKGFHLHFKLMETENLDLMEDNELWLYYREMVARFGHHLAITWNLGEENDLDISDIQDRAIMLRKWNPWTGKHVVVHTFPFEVDLVYPQLLGLEEITGISLQDGYQDAAGVLVNYDTLSSNNGHQWVVCYDEVNSAWHGVTPDAGYPGPWTSNPPNQNVLREKALVQPLMSGAEGVESYFGYDLPMSDLDAEDFRSRDQWWDYCRWAKDAVEMVPFWQMDRADQYTTDPSDEWVLSDGISSWLFYSKDGGDLDYNLPTGQYEVQLIDMTTGIAGSVNTFFTGAGYIIGLGTGADYFAVVNPVSVFDVNSLEVKVRGADVCWRAPDETIEIEIQSQVEGAWGSLHSSSFTEGCWENTGCESKLIRVIAREFGGRETISNTFSVIAKPAANFTEEYMYVDCVEGSDYELMDIVGRRIRSGIMSPEGVNVGGLLAGHYLVRIGIHTYRITRE